MRGFGGQGVAGRGRGGERQVFPVVGAGEDQLRASVRQVLHVLMMDGCVNLFREQNSATESAVVIEPKTRHVPLDQGFFTVHRPGLCYRYTGRSFLNQ